MLRKLLALFGYRIEYVCAWGTWSHRYDRWGGFLNWGHDAHFQRPIHHTMSVAPPWAKMRIRKCPAHAHEEDKS